MARFKLKSNSAAFIQFALLISPVWGWAGVRVVEPRPLADDLAAIECVLAQDPYCDQILSATGEKFSALIRSIKRDDPAYFQGRYYRDNGKKARTLVLTRAAELYFAKRPDLACPEGVLADD